MSSSLRSVFNQLQRKSRPVGGSIRNYSSTTRSNNGSEFPRIRFWNLISLADIKKVGLASWLVSASVGVYMGRRWRAEDDLKEEELRSKREELQMLRRRAEIRARVRNYFSS